MLRMMPMEMVSVEIQITVRAYITLTKKTLMKMV